MPFLLCFSLHLIAIFQVQAPAGGLFVDRFGGIIFRGAYFRNFTVSEECKISKLRWKILWLPYTAVLLSFTEFFSDIPCLVLVSVYYIYPLPTNLISKFKSLLICCSRVHLKTRSGQAPIFHFQYSSERDSMHVITSWTKQKLCKLDLVFKAMFTYRITFTPARKLYRIGHLLTHRNGDFGGISVKERIFTAQISKVKRHISDRFCTTLKCSVTRYLSRSGSE